MEEVEKKKKKKARIQRERIKRNAQRNKNELY